MTSGMPCVPHSNTTLNKFINNFIYENIQLVTSPQYQNNIRNGFPYTHHNRVNIQNLLMTVRI